MGGLIVSNLHVSTMTFACDVSSPISLYNIQTQEWANSFKNAVQNSYEVDHIAISGFNGEDICRFKNCVFVKITLRDKTKRSIMVFTKGYVQVAGCKSEEDGRYILSATCKSFNSIATNFKCRLINSNFKINHSFDWQKTIDFFQSRVIQLTFDQERHSAIHLKVKTPLDNLIKVFIFLKGSIIVTGGTHIEDIEYVYTWIKTLLQDSYKTITSDEVIEQVKIKKRPGRKRKADTSEFYSQLDITF